MLLVSEEAQISQKGYQNPIQKALQDQDILSEPEGYGMQYKVDKEMNIQ